jgi:hypothetical protein
MPSHHNDSFRRGPGVGSLRLWDVCRQARVDLEAYGYQSIVDASVTSLNRDDDTSMLPVGSGDRRSCRIRFAIIACGSIPGFGEPEFSDAEHVADSAYEANARPPDSADLTDKRDVAVWATAKPQINGKTAEHGTPQTVFPRVDRPETAKMHPGAGSGMLHDTNPALGGPSLDAATGCSESVFGPASMRSCRAHSELTPQRELFAASLRDSLPPNRVDDQCAAA